MAKDPRLEKLRSMDPTIGTFTARELVSSPDFVHETYLGHAETYMTLGNVSDYTDTLLRWARTNKGAVMGALSGKYGYGKTSTAIHLWQQCEQARVIAVPPFEWHRLQDIVDATSAWVRYRIGQIQPGAVAQVDQIYERYREKSIQEFADEEDMPVSKVQELLERRKVSLRCHPEDVVEFLAEVSRLLEGDALQLYGPIVFTDELQVTMSRYLSAHRSRDEFMQDLFELLNPLLNRQGSFGLMIGLPLATEALISEIRSDILQRLQHCNLFIRPNTMYDRDFPKELWQRFAGVFEFADIAADVLPTDTLDSLGQIAFRDDLGAGPRTVIEAMVYAVGHYDQAGQSFSPIELMDAYLGHQIAFDAGGKLVTAVTEVLQSREVQQIPDGSQVVKLAAAFPMGCPEGRFQDYGLQDARDGLFKRLYTEYFYKFPEGVSLRKLAPTERGAEPRFIELTKDFIQTYAESERELQAAVQAFDEVVLREQLLISRRVDQIEGWIPDPQVARQWIGTFDRKYPERRLAVRVSTDRSALTKNVEEFGLAFWFDPGCGNESPGRIERVSEAGTLALFCLNLLRRPSKPLNVPYIEELGYPLRKVTPAFMLALLQYLRSNEHSIPEDEKRLQLPPFVRSLVSYSVQLLFSEELLENAEFDGLSKVGLALPQEVFSCMCRTCYPVYDTLITTGRWQGAYTAYLNALQSQRVSSSVGILRGNRLLEMSQRDVLALLGETRAQAVKGMAENLSSILEVNLGSKADFPSAVRFRLHPAEEAFMEALRGSEDKLAQGQMSLRVLDQHEGLDLFRRLGYRKDEYDILLHMLKTRRLVGWDNRRQCFVEVLESPDERREAILAALSDLTQRSSVLAQIPDFNEARFSAEADGLKQRASSCNDVEKLEEYQTQLAQLRDVLVEFAKKWANKIQFDLDQVHNASGQVLRTSLPAELTRPLKGDVSWVGELVQCQALLKEKYQQCHTAFRDVDNQATTMWSTWTCAHHHDAAALLTLYETNRTLQSELKQAQASLAAAQGYLQTYQAWSSVLNAASRAYREALGCETSYKESQFRQELDALFGEITGQFQKRRLEALPQHEMYTDQIRETQSRIDNWLRDRRESFMQAKQFYEEMLKVVGVGRFNLHANFDPFDPEASRSNLCSEVLEKMRQHLDSVEQELNRHRTEALYAERVVCADVSEPSTKIKQARDELIQTKKQLQLDCVQQQECFSSLAEALSQLSATIQAAGQGISGILQKRPTTTEEESVLSLLQDPRGTDFSVVIASRLAEEDAGFSLDMLMQVITSLFKKNQVVIRLEKRR